jgi:hypothetical protein
VRQTIHALLSALVFALLGGCAQNAVFELHVRLPSIAASPAGTRFARIRTGSQRLEFDQTWLTSATPPIELLPDETQTVMVSIVATGAQLREDLRVKVELYASEDGEALEERRYEFQHPFYQGHYTCFESLADDDFANPALDDRDAMGVLRDVLPVVDVDRCHIVGCVTSNSLDVGQCTSDGTHNCETSSALVTASACDEILGRDRNVGM